MHSFHSSDYLQCMVEADALDRDAIDLINTARTNFMEGNEVVGALRAKVAEIMKSAIREHGKFRQKQAVKELETDPTAQIIMKTVSVLPSKSRKAATKHEGASAAGGIPLCRTEGRHPDHRDDRDDKKRADGPRRSDQGS